MFGGRLIRSPLLGPEDLREKILDPTERSIGNLAGFRLEVTRDKVRDHGENAGDVMLRLPLPRYPERREPLLELLGGELVEKIVDVDKPELISELDCE